MAFANPSDSSEILYGASGDVRSEITANANASDSGHYIDEQEMPGALVIRALRKATRIINGYLEVVYADEIPFGSTGVVPKLLDEISTDLATFYCLRSLAANLGPVSEEKKRDYYDAYINPDGENGILQKIANREVQLPELTASYPNDAQAVRAQNRAPIFDVDSDRNHNVDPRLLEDIEDEREK